MQKHTHTHILGAFMHSSGKKKTKKHFHFRMICGIYQTINWLTLITGGFHGFQVTRKYTDTYSMHEIVWSHKYNPPNTQTHIHPHTQVPHSTFISHHTQQLRKQNPSNQDCYVPVSPHFPCRNWTTTDTTLYSPDPDCEVGSGGEHNCMLKRLRNERPVLLSWCFLCGLIVGTCSHAALWVPVGVHVGLGVVQKSGRGGNIV